MVVSKNVCMMCDGGRNFCMDSLNHHAIMVMTLMVSSLDGHELSDRYPLLSLVPLLVEDLLVVVEPFFHLTRVSC
jgi:hypothetical protein